MKTVADLHTHTLVSQHAFSSLNENIEAAKRKGLVALGMTDHAPAMPDGAMAHHFLCLTGLPEYIDGLRLYRGAELNIVDFSGGVDLTEDILEGMDFVVASYHIECILPGTEEVNTSGLLNIISNPHIDCIGHCGNPVFPITIPLVVSACKDYGKLIEINANSPKVRPGSEAICREIALECKKQGVQIIVGSDAHHSSQVGEHGPALQMLESIAFPEELVVNSSAERLERYFADRGRKL